MKTSVIEKETWSRREIFDHFSRISFPFYVVSMSIETHNLYKFCKQNGIGVYHSMIWCICQACNSVPAFKQRIVKDEIIEYDKVNPSYTFLRSGEDAFKVCTLEAGDDIITFDRTARLYEEKQSSLFADSNLSPDSLVYLSCLPWIETTCVSSERHIDVDDSIPRIAWGKFRKQPDGTIIQNLTVDVNHRLIDGYHIGLFGKALQDIINNL